MSDALRPAQQEVLRYTGGKLAISAVPGAGKTFILTRLATRLIKDLGVSPKQILILTYMRSAASIFKSRIAEALAAHDLTAYGLQAMTIHAFCLSVLKRHHATKGDEPEGERPMVILSEPEQKRILIEGMNRFCEQAGVLERLRQRFNSRRPEFDPIDAAATNARRLISAAKHFRLSHNDLCSLLTETHPEVPFLYRHYCDRQASDGWVDFDDQIQQAISLLKEDPALLDWHHRRFSFVLEDEAQDSTPAQHELISLLTERNWGGAGNLVRVGDSNQAIMTTFSFSDPRYFREFCHGLDGDRHHVRMDESSRSAAEVLDLANALVAFTATHPDPAVAAAFVVQPIRSATAGKENPVAYAPPTWTVFQNADTEREQVLIAVRRFLSEHPAATAAVLLYRNMDVDRYAQMALAMGIPLFQGAVPGVASAKALIVLERFMGVLAHPGGAHAVTLFDLVEEWLSARGDGLTDAPAAKAFLKGTGLEALVYPLFGLPPVRPEALCERDYAALLIGAGMLHQALDARHLPPEELLPLIAESYFDDPAAALIAAKALRAARRQLAHADPQPDNPWLALQQEFRELRKALGFKELLVQDASLARPEPGQLQILTMHRSKGAEYGAVWLPALGFGAWGYNSPFPWHGSQAYVGDLDPLIAEGAIKRGTREGLPPRAVLEAEAKAAMIAERLRLLYVGITRAERALHLSCAYDRDGGDPAPLHLLHLAARCSLSERSRA